MKTYSFPSGFIWSWKRTETVYIYDYNGTMTWDCKPGVATETREFEVHHAIQWPLKILFRINDTRQGCCSLNGVWHVFPHRIYLVWNGLFRRRFVVKHLFSWRIK